MNTTLEEKQNKKELLDKCWSYLNDNFHKFTITNQIKIALSLVQKDMPTQLSGEVVRQIIQIGSNGKSEGLLNRLESKPETINTNE